MRPKPKTWPRVSATAAIVLTGAVSYTTHAAAPTEAELLRGFKGKIELDTRDSKPDWTPFIPKKAPEGAPNILFILYDDTGQAAWSPYGGRVSMPTLDKLAADGLIYTQWHTTSLCAPTRSTLQTGRNHHLNSFGSITETASGYPGYNGRFPKQVTTIAEVLQANGYATL
ncbi:MAG: sulfatase-like hydrolase/transferase, partial [Anaerolineales bacterium]